MFSCSNKPTQALAKSKKTHLLGKEEAIVVHTNTEFPSSINVASNKPTQALAKSKKTHLLGKEEAIVVHTNTEFPSSINVANCNLNRHYMCA